MGLLSSLLNPDRSPGSDYWYSSIGSQTKAGVLIGEDQILKISAVLQGVRFLSQTVAGLPRFVYRHLADGRSRVKETSHPLNRILRYQPNPWQTSFQFVEQLTAQAMLKGIGIAQRIYNNDELVGLYPLEPARIVRIDRMSNGQLRYLYRLEDGRPRMFRQDELFVLLGFGISGVRGLPLLDQMCETAGLEVATENYGARFFANNNVPRVICTSPKAVSAVARRRMGADWDRAYGGDNQHAAAFLEEDTKVQVLSTKNDEAQFIETRRFLIAEFSRYMDVTPHRLSDLEKSSYNNMEQMSLETVIYSLMPWLRRWEQCSYRDLLTEEDKEAGIFIEFVIEGLLRGDTNARSTFYQSGINTGWLTRNEAREKENLNPLPGLDDPLQPQNMMPVGQESAPPPNDAGMDRAQAIARAAAERVVRREFQSVAKWGERKNGDPAHWAEQVTSFYRDHVDFLAKAMAMDEERAKRCCALHCDCMLRLGQGDNDGALGGWLQEAMIETLVKEALRQ